MIIFYRKSDGRIVGTVDGRIHNDDQLKMWIGSDVDNGRIVVQWIPVKWYDKDGNELSQEDKDLAVSADYRPDHSQSDIFFEIDKNPGLLREYAIDTSSTTLIKTQL